MQNQDGRDEGSRVREYVKKRVAPQYSTHQKSTNTVGAPLQLLLEGDKRTETAETAGAIEDKKVNKSHSISQRNFGRSDRPMTGSEKRRKGSGQHRAAETGSASARRRQCQC